MALMRSGERTEHVLVQIRRAQEQQAQQFREQGAQVQAAIKHLKRAKIIAIASSLIGLTLFAGNVAVRIFWPEILPQF